MRNVPQNLLARLQRPIQTGATNADPALGLWISRPVTPLVDTHFLERQVIHDSEGGTTALTACSIAVCHPLLGRQSTRIYLAFIDGGQARVVSSAWRAVMETHTWVDCGIDEAAIDVSLAFDGTMPTNTAGRVEFVTERQPWMFWVFGGALYARKLGSTQAVILADENCTAVSAVRAAWSQAPGFDFGLCCFFVMNGAVYYRQLIDGEWCDATQVPDGVLPQANTYTDVAASRTWDYRVVLQAKTSDGQLIEAYTQYGGIGIRNQEHISMDVEAVGTLTEIHYTDTRETEHIALTGVTAEGWLWSTDVPVLVSAYNQDNGAGDWGTRLVCTLDVHIRKDIEGEGACFTLTDGVRSFTPSVVELQKDKLTLVLTFTDFNALGSPATIRYTPGTTLSMADTPLEAMEVSFTPQGLVPPQIDPPEALEAWNE